MAIVSQTRATLDDLLREPGKAELIGGRILPLMPTGFRPNQVTGLIFVGLLEFTRRTARGIAFTDNMGFAVPELPSGRASFSPDAAYYAGPLPADPMRFIDGPPTLAVEVRGEGDYGPAAEAALAAKRADYFAAGTAVVWDVDTIAERILVYRAATPDRPAVYGRGETAEAEPAVSGWRVAVDAIFG